MGGRGASSTTNNADAKFISQLVKDIDLLDNGDLQGEAEAYAMQKYGAENYRQVIAESDRLLNEARRIKDYTDAIDTGETIVVEKKGNIEGARFRVKDGKVQVSAEVLDLNKRGEWFDHPTFTKKTLLNHLKRLEKEGRNIHT